MEEDMPETEWGVSEIGGIEIEDISAGSFDKKPFNLKDNPFY